MEKILAVVLGLAVLGFIGYKAMGTKSKPDEIHVPTERLENVRNAAHEIEVKQNAAAEKALEKATPE
jgi:hypothetical protein